MLNYSWNTEQCTDLIVYFTHSSYYLLRVRYTINSHTWKCAQFSSSQWHAVLSNFGCWLAVFLRACFGLCQSKVQQDYPFLDQSMLGSTIISGNMPPFRLPVVGFFQINLMHYVQVQRIDIQFSWKQIGALSFVKWECNYSSVHFLFSFLSHNS